MILQIKSSYREETERITIVEVNGVNLSNTSLQYILAHNSQTEVESLVSVDYVLLDGVLLYLSRKYKYRAEVLEQYGEPTIGARRI